MIPLRTLCALFRSALVASALLFLIGSLLPARGQSTVVEDNCSGGTLYLLAFPDTTTNTYDARFPAALLRTKTTAFNFYIYSPVDQQVTIGRYGGAGQRVSLRGGEILEYNTEQMSIPLITVNNTPQTNVLKVEAEYPVIVYCYMMTPFGCEAWTAIPVESWGKEYYIASWPGEVVRDIFPKDQTGYRTIPKEAPGEILIIAAYDNTQVRINPKAILKECSGCQTVTLKAGEAYHVQGTVDTSFGAEKQPDLGGTYIQASKRIGVISGNTRMSHDAEHDTGLAKNSFKNLAIEWISPPEQHGTDFVFTPTWDERRQRDGLPLEESRKGEFVRIFGTHEGETEISWVDNLGASVPGTKPSVLPGELSDEKISLPVSRYYHTTQPAMAMMSPQSVAAYDGITTTFGSVVGTKYRSWSTYMTELIPREQWTSFAPVRAPSLPSSMIHYMNLVTDTGNQFNVYYRQGNNPRQLFPFNRGKVPGSDLVWGSIPLSSGIDYFIEGDNDARFTGQVYGVYAGQEQYRPGGSPSEYEEDISLMYGYPLAPSRCVLASPDEFEITTSQGCYIMDIHIISTNPNPSGIRSITILPDSSQNIRLEFIDPTSPLDLTSQTITEARLRLVPIDPTKDAYAVVIVKGRTREDSRERIVYHWEAERVNFKPSDELNFGEVSLNTSAGERLITISNPLSRNVVVRRLSFVLGTESFVIKRVDPAFDWSGGNDSIVLKPGDSIRVWIDITPTTERLFLDFLRVKLGCIEVTIPVKATTALPCLFVNDLDFGTMNVGESRTLPLEICNKGKGSVTFQDPFLTWLAPEFEVSNQEIDKLRGKVLDKDDCVTVRITFHAPANKTGPFRTTGRFWADTRQCRDTSIWKANVIKPGPQITGYDWGKRWVSENPCTKNPEQDYPAIIQAGNTGTSPFEVVDIKIASGSDPDGVFKLGLTSVEPGLIMQPQSSYDVEVIFDPKEEKVYYPNPTEVWFITKIKVNDQDVLDTARTTLEGIGIESYVSVGDVEMGRVEFTGSGSVTVQGSVVISSTGTRPTTITNIAISPPTNFRLKNATPLPVTIPPGESISVDVDFIPQDLLPQTKRATIYVEGDFAYDYCSISDSIGTLSGTTFKVGAVGEGYDFGTILTCYERDGVITVRNTGTDPVQVTNFTQAGNSGFTVDPRGTIVLPAFLAAAGDTNGKDVMRIPVRFAPDRSGTFSGNVSITVISQDGTTEIAQLVVPLRGEAKSISSTMSIGQDYRGNAGSVIPVQVMLDNDPSEATVQEFILDLDYDPEVVNLTDLSLGSLFSESDGWTFEIIDKQPGHLIVRIYNTAERFMSGAGEVLVLDFIALDVAEGNIAQTELPFNITPVTYGENQQPCVEFATLPGLITVDKVVGNKLLRSVSIVEVTPNPLKNKGNIRISVTKKQKVQLAVYWPDGRRVSLLFDKELEANIHDIPWDASGLINGAYYVQIKAGEDHDSRSVIIVR